MLRQVWAKSAELLANGKVTKAPSSNPKARVVASTSMKRPHFVETTDKHPELFECDENCPAFLQQHLCSHIIAAAKDNNLLQQYLEYYGKFAKSPKGRFHSTPNYTRLSMNDLPRGTAGRKGNKAPKKKPIKRKRLEENRQDVTSQLPTTSTSAVDSCSSNSYNQSSYWPPYGPFYKDTSPLTRYWQIHI